MDEQSKRFYFAYYKLHDIPWKLKKPLKLEINPDGIIIELGKGPYRVPKMASPIVATKAGGAEIQFHNEVEVLEGNTYFGVAIPLLGDFKTGPSWDIWFEPSEKADNLAMTVGLCLNQRFSLQKVAEFIRPIGENVEGPDLMFRFSIRGGQKASVSERSSKSIQRAILNIINQQVEPQVKVALRWYEQSKNVVAEADRLVALWISLEALMPTAKTHKELVNKTARYLTQKEFKLGLDAEGIKKALGLEAIRDMRNEIIHEGKRPTSWPAPNNSLKRDRPQILDDIVGEVLRHKLNATLQRTLDNHVKRGLG